VVFLSYLPSSAPSLTESQALYGSVFSGLVMAAEAEGDALTEEPSNLVLRSVFVYGTLMAEEVVDALLAPGSGTARSGLRTSRPGKVFGYGRWCLRGNQEQPGMQVMPGALPAGPLVRCDGHLLERLQPSELKVLDSFHDPRFKRIVVEVQAEDGFGGKQVVEALMYVCPSNAAELVDTQKPWNYAEFRSNYLNRFIAEVARPHRKRFEEQEAMEREANAQAAAPS